MLRKLCKLARIAGSIIMKSYNSNELINVSYKSDNSPVTSIDLEVSQIIKKELLMINPNIPIISEEELYDFNTCKFLEDYWLIDPLDGTKEFLKKNGEFTVNISLIKKGNPVLGVIYAPFFDILYSGFEKNAFKEIQSEKKEKINIFCKNKTPPLLVISRSHPDTQLAEYLKNIKHYKLKKIGSSLKFCLVAEGVAQIYPRFGNTCIWDTAAGQAILIAAGGKIKTWNGNHLNYSLSSCSSFINPGFCAYSS